MRILLLSHMYPRPGSEHYGLFVHEPAQALADLGHEVDVVSPQPWLPPGAGLLSATWRPLASLPAQRDLDGLRLHHPRYLHLPRRIAFASGAGRMARAVLKLPCLSDYDILHAHAALPDGAAARRIASALGLPLVITSHGSDVVRASTWSRAAHREIAEAFATADAVLLPSEAHRLRVLAAGLPVEACRVLWNGFDAATFLADTAQKVQPEAASEEAKAAAEVEPESAKAGPLRMICVANLVPSKRLPLLLEAMGLLRERQVPASLHLIGSGPEGRDLEEQARRLGLDVNQDAGLGRHELASALRSADVFALPARNESFGIVYLEAMAAGLPVIAPTGEGISELVERAGSGLLLEDDSPATLADALARLAGDGALRRELGNAGIRAAKELSWDAHAARLVSIYEEVLAKRAEAGR